MVVCGAIASVTPAVLPPAIFCLLAFAPIARPATFRNDVQPFLAKTCYTCHNAKLQSGSLNLERLATATSVDTNRPVWEQVLHKLETGEMPPPGVARPDTAEVNAVTM